ncbi:MAG: hypothetical protein Q8K75_09140 [Chlamydiales bacterium]|nr:hypothetical protein [Chlamydiales bacterium]
MEFSNIDIKDLACFICEVLRAHAIEAVLVGGACVSIYSHNRYQSYDLDFVTYEDLNRIEKALGPIGFKRTGRCFAHEDCQYIIDFVNPPIAIGRESIQKFETISNANGSLQLLRPTDCVKDRLASYFYWNDAQALEQALLVAEDCDIDLRSIKLWAKAEGHQEKLEHFLKKVVQE